MDDIGTRKFGRLLCALNTDNCDVSDIGVREKLAFKFGGRNYYSVFNDINPILYVETYLGIPK